MFGNTKNHAQYVDNINWKKKFSSNWQTQNKEKIWFNVLQTKKFSF